MRWMCGLLSGLLIQAVACPPAAAQAAMAQATRPEALHLDALLAEALAQNPDILAARKQFDAARARIPLAKGLPAPRIGVEFEEIPRGSIKLNQATIMYSLIQSLPFPGKLSARHRVAVAEAQRAGMAFKQAEWNVISQLKSAYYDLWLLDREREILNAQRLWLRQAAAAAQSRYATGMRASTEVLRLQTEELDTINAITVAMHRREATVAHLNHLLNRPMDQPVGEPGALSLIPLPFSPAELVLIAKERQPELLMFKFSSERAEAASRLAKRELLPDLETMVELRDPAMGPVGPWALSLAFLIPFWFWTKWRYGLKIALYDQASAQAAYTAMTNEIARRIYEHWHEAQAAYGTAKLCEDSLISLSQQAVASAMAAYQVGQGSSLELLDALRALSERRRTYDQHLAAFEQHVVMLEEAAGISLHPEYAVEIPDAAIAESLQQAQRGHR